MNIKWPVAYVVNWRVIINEIYVAMNIKWLIECKYHKVVMNINYH